jgi:ketosteroid isomerase-like protein
MTDEEVLEQLERTWVEALRDGDAAALAEIWDEAFVFTDPTGKSLTRDECLEHLATGAIALEVAELRTVKAQVFGDTGAVLGYIALRGRGGKTLYDGEYSFVDIYTKRDGRWRAVLSSGDLASQLLS